MEERVTSVKEKLLEVRAEALEEKQSNENGSKDKNGRNRRNRVEGDVAIEPVVDIQATDNDAVYRARVAIAAIHHRDARDRTQAVLTAVRLGIVALN